MTPALRNISLALAAFALAACSGGVEEAASTLAVRTPAAKLTPLPFVADCSDFLRYASDALTEQYLAPAYVCFNGPCPVFATPEGAPSSAAPGSSGADSLQSAALRTSQTNTQEAGVDEPDIVKTDRAGNLYILASRSLQLLAALPPQDLAGRSVAALDLSGGAAQGYFHAQDFLLDEAHARAVILATDYAPAQGLRSVKIIVDVSNPAAPRELLRLSVDGYGINTRRIGDRVHHVSRFYVPAPAWFYNSDDALQGKRNEYYQARSQNDQTRADRLETEVRTEITRRVSAAGAQVLLPRIRREETGAAPTERTLACNAISHPEVTTGLGLAVVESFNTDGGSHAISALINNAYLSYTSAQNLYLAQTSAGWFFAPRQVDQSVIYRLALSATGPAVYQSLGLVDGFVRDAYSMSEHDGYLRVATTEFRSSADRFTSYNHLSVLSDTGTGEMRLTGALRDLAPGETLQAARLIGPRGYMVTFRRIDPLFALDLSNPALPAVTDELKIPGFSSYIMPLGDNHLLTIGREGNNDEQLTGQVAIQLFDVSNPRGIRQSAVLSAAVEGGGQYSYSPAEYDPHAFSYFPDSAAAPLPGTLSVPLQSYDFNTGEGFSGFLAVSVNPTASAPLAELGRITHKDFAANQDYCSGSGSGGTPVAPCRSAYYAAQPRRSVFMQDGGATYLYTLSSLGIIASDAAQPATELGRRALNSE